MAIVAGILLALATLVTLLVVELLTTARHVGGADAMGLVTVFPLLGTRWLALAGAVLIAARRGALGWIHPTRAVQAIAALLWLALSGAASVTSVIMAYGPDSHAVVPWALALAVGVPAVVIAGTAAALCMESGAAWPRRLAATAVTLVVACGAVRLFGLAYVTAREALRFMWLWMPNPPAALAAPARDAIAALPDWAERWLAKPLSPPPSAEDAPDPVPALDPVDLNDMAQAAIVIADAYQSSDLDFETPIAAFARVLERHALPEERLGEDATYQPRAYLRTWLDRRTARRRGGE